MRRVKNLWIGVALSIVMATSLLNCKDDVITGPEGSPSSVVFPAAKINYQTHVQKLFNEACARAGCHVTPNPAGGLSLQSYFDVTVLSGNTGRAVIAFQPELGTLIQRIEGRSSQRMPLGLNPLNQNQITGIRQWIAEGAKDTTYSANQ